MAGAPTNRLVIKRGYIASGNSQVTGSLIVSAGVTGSLLGTASNATLAADSDRLGNVGAASYALNTSITGFATTSSLTSYALATSTTGFATTGSNTFTGNQNVTGNVNITGTLTANTYIVSSSLTNMTVAFASGSTAFGNSTDDTHNFTGSLSVLGSINAGTGGITGSFKGDGAGLTGVTATAIFPTTAITNLASSNQFYVNDGANKYVTYGDLLTDLAGTNLVVEGTDSLALNTTVAGLTSVTSATLSGSFVNASTYVSIGGGLHKIYAGTGDFNLGANAVISVDYNTYEHAAIHVKYVLYNKTGTALTDMRAGTLMIVRNASQANIAEATTQDIGNTLAIDFTVAIVGTSTIITMDTTDYSETVTLRYEYTLL